MRKPASNAQEVTSTILRFLKRISGKGRERLTEAELLHSYYQGGDLHVLAELYQPHMELIFSICYKYLRKEEEAQDAVMQLFEKLVVDLRVHQVDNFKSWLHSVARNYCLMEMRKQKVVVGEELADSNEVVAEWDGTEEALQLDRNLLALENCMQQLATEQRSAVQLFYMEEKCYREIADQTGYELSKVKSYIQNGKRNLKICMDKNG